MCLQCFHPTGECISRSHLQLVQLSPALHLSGSSLFACSPSLGTITTPKPLARCAFFIRPPLQTGAPSTQNITESDSRLNRENPLPVRFVVPSALRVLQTSILLDFETVPSGYELVSVVPSKFALQTYLLYVRAKHLLCFLLY